MALVGEIVARFKAETSDYLAKLDAAKTKNRELAQQLLDTAGSADKAMATLKMAKQKGALGDFGIDPRQLGGVQSAIREIEREKAKAIEATQKTNLQHDVANIKLMTQLEFVKRIGSELNRVTTKAVELRRAYMAGEKRAADVAEEIGRSLPIIGGGVSSTLNIIELFGGMDSIRQVQRLQDTYTELARTQWNMVQAHRQIVEQVKRWRQETQDLAAENAAREAEALNDPLAAGMSRAQKNAKELRDAQAKITAEAEAKITELQKAIGDPTDKNSLAYRLAQAQKELAGKEQVRVTEVSQVKALRAELEAILDRQREIRAEAATAARERGDKIKSRQRLEDEVAYADEILKAAEAMGQVADEAERAAKAVGKEFVDKLADGLAKAADEAERFRQSLLTDAEKITQEVERLRANPFVAGSDIRKYLQGEYDRVQESMKGLGKSQPVYSLPSISELRSGMTLYVPPSKIDEQQLQQLKEMKTVLEAIREAAKSAGITIQEISL